MDIYSLHSSGLLSKTLKPSLNVPLKDRLYAGVFSAGLVVAGAAGSIHYGAAFESWDTIPVATRSIAGLLVGFGSQLGNGCTSGHGICGISSFRLRSLVATCTFMATGAITAVVMDTQQYLPHFANTLSLQDGQTLAAVTVGTCLLLLPVGVLLPEKNAMVQTAFRLMGEAVTGVTFATGLIVSNMTRCRSVIPSWSCLRAHHSILHSTQH